LPCFEGQACVTPPHAIFRFCIKCRCGNQGSLAMRCARRSCPTCSIRTLPPLPRMLLSSLPSHSRRRPPAHHARRIWTHHQHWKLVLLSLRDGLLKLDPRPLPNQRHRKSATSAEASPSVQQKLLAAAAVSNRGAGTKEAKGRAHMSCKTCSRGSRPRPPLSSDSFANTMNLLCRALVRRLP
jgi:hypothetical protein